MLKLARILIWVSRWRRYSSRSRRGARRPSALHSQIDRHGTVCLVKVDGLLVEGGESGWKETSAITLGSPVLSITDEIVAGNGTEANGVGRIGVGGSSAGLCGIVHKSSFLEECAQLGSIVAAEFSPGGWVIRRRRT